jgi:hypothetical protein
LEKGATKTLIAPTGKWPNLGGKKGEKTDFKTLRLLLLTSEQH